MSEPSTTPVATSPAPPEPNAPPRQYSVLAGFLSYLIPGLGQISQGRIGKGMVFMVCLLGMFFTGQAMGNWKNVYLPDVAKGPDDPNPWHNNPWRLPRVLSPIANVYHRWHYAGQFWIGAAAWPALWQYYKLPLPSEEANPFLHNLQRGPANEDELNDYLTNSDKTPDLAWVYTVIAGVLNILVIYDAYAGPALGPGPPKLKEPTPPPEGAAT